MRNHPLGINDSLPGDVGDVEMLRVDSGEVF